MSDTPKTDEERTVLLEDTSSADSALRHRVDAALAAKPSDSTTAMHSVGPSGTIVSDDEATLGASATLGPEETPGDFIGRYKLLEKLGEGGFGMVYIAEQTEPVKRHVALKIIKLGMDTRQVVARFEAERQALALMEHPNIAKVLDAGATDTGRPYFVMELVRGTKITEYCDHNKLPTRKRLDLFMLVCRAVEHAHQKGIIHRDIKPSNILVTMLDGVAVPKVIDFGIAKATQGSSNDKSANTLFDQFIGTPAYMSPEQAEAGGLDIDTRSDIYSLGVLLYELLTGETPLESKNLLSRGFEEMRKLIREWEPQRPSIRLHKQGEKDQTTVAKRHSTDAPKLIKMVRGDLDWVVMKCLEKDRTRRYDTAAELTREIQRFLSNEPVTARPPSKVYRFEKLVRRNRLAFAAGSAIFLSLVIGLCATSWFMVKEKREREFAELASQVAKKNLKIAQSERAQAERALGAATEARNKSDVDQQLRQEARAKAEAAEHAAAASGKEADEARLEAAAASERAQQDRDKASAAEQAEKISEVQAKAAEARAESESAKREEAIKAEATESVLRQQSDAARTKAEAALKAAEAASATAITQAARSQTVISNFLGSLAGLPPAMALKAVNHFYQPGDEKQPWAAPFLRERGEWRARVGDWTNAANDFSQSLDVDPTDANSYHALAALFRQSGDSNVLAGLHARTLTNEIRLGDNRLATGLAAYRQNHYDAAEDAFNKILAANETNPIVETEACAGLAMAQQQLKKTDAAHLALARATQVAATKLPKPESGDIGSDWMQWIMAQSLLREAATTVK